MRDCQENPETNSALDDILSQFLRAKKKKKGYDCILGLGVTLEIFERVNHATNWIAKGKP